MSAPKKMTLLLVSLLIIVILIGVFESSTIINIINPPRPTPEAHTGTIDGLIVSGDNYNDSDGLAIGQKMDAIHLAMNNSTVKESIKEFKNISPNVTIGPVTLSNQDFRSGYLNLPNVVNVPIQFGESFTQENIIAYVDIKNNTTIGVECWWSKEQIEIDTLIPAGAGWYHRLMGPWINASDEISRVEMHFRVIYSPDDARLYPIIVDESNFNQYKNGSAFSAVTYVDYLTNRTTSYDGTMPVIPACTLNGTGLWEPHMSFGDAILPDYYNKKYPNYYIILINVDNRTAYILNFNLGP